MRVLITCRQMQNCFDSFASVFAEHGLDVTMPEVTQQLTEAELMATIGDFDGMIAGDDHLTERVLSYATRMRVISKWGIGLDGIDLDAARERGIEITNTPGVFGGEVADVALGYVVMLARQLRRLDASVRAGGWFKHEGRSLSAMTLGVVGFGDIGRSIARRAQGFDMAISAYDPLVSSRDVAASMGVRAIALDDLFSSSDVLVLSLPLTPDTQHLVDERRLGLMPPRGFLVNVARGRLVDEQALVAALSSGHLSAAALDVFEDEPLPASSKLRSFEQCVFGTHNASNTSEGVLRASERAVLNLLGGLGLG
jgi:D-3-phosphoglycerate dehydrogenase / 2-oxoglutarate reductase